MINVMTRAGRGHRHHHHGVRPGCMWETFRNSAGYGATVATIMFLVLLAVTYYQVRVMDRGGSGRRRIGSVARWLRAAMLLVADCRAVAAVFFTSFADQPMRSPPVGGRCAGTSAELSHGHRADPA